MLSPNVNNPANLVGLFLKPLTTFSDSEHPPWQTMNPAPGTIEVAQPFVDDITIGIIVYDDTGVNEIARTSPMLECEPDSFFITVQQGQQVAYIQESNQEDPAYEGGPTSWAGSVQFANVEDVVVDVQWAKSGNVFCIANELGNGDYADMLVEETIYVGMLRSPVEVPTVYKLAIFDKATALNIPQTAAYGEIIWTRNSKAEKNVFCAVWFDGNKVMLKPQFPNDCSAAKAQQYCPAW
jgi:hypothetical protein